MALIVTIGSGLHLLVVKTTLLYQRNKFLPRQVFELGWPAPEPDDIPSVAITGFCRKSLIKSKYKTENDLKLN